MTSSEARPDSVWIARETRSASLSRTPARLRPRRVRVVSHARHLGHGMNRAAPCRNLCAVPSRRALAVLAAGAAMGLLAQYLFVRERAGLNMPVAAIAFLVAGWLVRDGANSTRAWRLAAASSSLAFAALCAIRTEAAVVFFDAAAAFLFAGAFVLACAGTSLAAPVIALVDDAMAMVGAAFVRPFGVWVAALPAARGSLVRASPVAGYAAGALIAVPFLVVFGALFAAALTLLVLTAAVVVSAGYRMALYQQAYGWSELRLYTFAGIGFIACALVILGWAVLARRMERALPALVAAAAAAALAVNAIAPADFVARRNIERVLHPASLPEDASRGLDVGYLVTLGEGAIPALFELAPELPSPERSAVLEVLRAATLRSETTVGWQSWNLDRERARSIVVRASGPGIFMR